MKNRTILAPQAVEDFEGLDARQRAIIRNAVEKYLRHEPEKISKSRIRRLKGLRKPQYRLRVGEIRIFYDVTKNTGEILAIVSKSNASKWLEQEGEQS